MNPARNNAGRRSLLFFLPFVFFLLLFGSGCGEKKENADDKESGEQSSITVAAAASLKDAFDEIGREFEKEYPGKSVRFNYAASNILARQIEEAAPFDVVALAAEETMNGLDSANLLRPGSRRVFARNRLCVVLSPDSKHQAKELSDLADPAFRRIAVASPGVPARIYTEETLRTAGLWDNLEGRFVYGENVRQVLGYVETGEVDCGFVYTSDAKASRTTLAFVIDSTLHRPILYPIAIVRNSPAPSVAEAFLSYLSGPAGEAILEKYGFKR